MVKKESKIVLQIVIFLLIMNIFSISALSEPRDSYYGKFIKWVNSLFPGKSLNNQVSQIPLKQEIKSEDSSVNYKNVEISFVKVTPKDKELFINYLNGVKDYWFEGTNKIIIYGDRNLFSSHSGCLAQHGLEGCNDNKGKIKIYFKSNNYTTKEIMRVICHEFGHSLISGISNNAEEKIVQDMTKNERVCFK